MGGVPVPRRGGGDHDREDAHIGVTATVYSHVRLRLQRQAIDALSAALSDPSEGFAQTDDGGDPPLCAAPLR
ncbi:hypothetical protein DN051_40470 [Streptomyces cadmiisoli]|uniref:Uncharacterized protein n=1 Tax=Streptomyces cadmiisoli TaxID=2184053 RepID=A0A2Z4JB05_9ACTN|nr:hypothetical protein DN051_00340 [Streptomyces cadmiisoli]AWW42991.1 hypothetical protein DN051_40470 [Streptomyces cadmiisoli]